MPTYDYVCEDCGHQVEIFQSFSEPAKRTCPKCRSRKFKRLIGAGAALIFKGSGFYSTDYRSDAYKAAEKSDAPPKEGGETGRDRGDPEPVPVDGAEEAPAALCLLWHSLVASAGSPRPPC